MNRELIKLGQFDDESKRKGVKAIMIGRIHSYETMGLHDGPGIRTVFFLQGCPLKCLYCHNPDTQKFDGGREMSTEEVVAVAKRYKPFYRRSGGGVTISGGEPLLQWEFLRDLFQRLREEGISIALDTSGYGGSNKLTSYDETNKTMGPTSGYLGELLSYVDHLLMDIKHVTDSKHLKLTGKNMEGTRDLLRELPDFHGKVWIRHVMVPGYTDNKKSMEALYCMIAPYQNKIEKVEILPYHKMGAEKYQELGRKDPLSGTPPMDVDKAREYELFLEKLLEAREALRTG
ncbi:pyruvate formate-lyase-activating protein [Isachenkonia alkalipeptolytica]|uniref:pyruvate formate-lyase-activating protein n=1 Tax=Isachenkonia alkalipeptolytica TaxID=2565777 RepID=UPI001EEDD815|nr:pyruvate formate-lyase-activating protein [Isachenkonia alkalipeptolytica]